MWRSAVTCATRLSCIDDKLEIRTKPMRRQVMKVKLNLLWEGMRNPKAISPTDIPISFEAITPEWLTAVICRSVPGARVMSHHLDSPDDGTSNRRRIFINYNETGRQSPLPPSVFCKASQGLKNRLTLGVSGAAYNETLFYNVVRPLVDLEAPHCHFANFSHHTLNSIIVLEDKRDQVTFCTGTTQVTRARAESQMSLLARLHARFYESAQLKTTLAEFRTWPMFWGEQVRAGQLEKYCNDGFVKAEMVIPASLFRHNAKIWPLTLASVDSHTKLPNGLIHSDVHLGNWYVTKTEQMGLGDWQACCKGHWSRDFAYAISTALTVANRRLWEKDLLEFYLQELARAGGPAIRFDDAWTYYRQQLFTALAYWTVTFNPNPEAPDMQPPATAIEFISRISQAMEDNESLTSF
jgi:hypothetical protein